MARDQEVDPLDGEETFGVEIGQAILGSPVRVAGGEDQLLRSLDRSLAVTRAAQQFKALSLAAAEPAAPAAAVEE